MAGWVKSAQASTPRSPSLAHDYRHALARDDNSTIIRIRINRARKGGKKRGSAGRRSGTYTCRRRGSEFRHPTPGDFGSRASTFRTLMSACTEAASGPSFASGFPFRVTGSSGSRRGRREAGDRFSRPPRAAIAGLATRVRRETPPSRPPANQSLAERFSRGPLFPARRERPP